MGDAVSLDALDRITQTGIVRLHLPEEGAALAHDHGHQVYGYRVEQAELEAFPRNRAGRFDASRPPPRAMAASETLTPPQ